MTKGLQLVTHSGAFHCDDVMGFAILRYALGLDRRQDWALARTRDPDMIAAADIVWDVGASADLDSGRFDHHMAGAPIRDCGTPYSSAGLIWMIHGRNAIRGVLAGARWTTNERPENGRPEVAPDVVERIWQALDQDLVRLIDMADNGRRPEIVYANPHEANAQDGLALPAIVDGYNPPWDVVAGLTPEQRSRHEDGRFLEAAHAAGAFLANRIHATRAALAVHDAVLTAHAGSADPRILELDNAMPWQETAHQAGLPTLLAVYPDSSGNAWMVNCMPPSPGSFEQKLPLPADWAGLRDAALARICGVPDAVFCHLGRFIAGACSREGAMTMARAALDVGRAAPAAARAAMTEPGRRPMNARSQERRRIVEDAILDRFHVTRIQAEEVGQAVRAASPSIDATDFEVALLWHKMSNPYVVGWLDAGDATYVSHFLLTFGKALGRQEALQAAPARTPA